MRLLEMSPTPRALTAEPLLPEEIDVHPDADRIWATVLSIKEAYDRAYDRGYDDGECEGRRTQR